MVASFCPLQLRGGAGACPHRHPSARVKTSAAWPFPLTKTSTGKDVVEPADAIRWSHIVLSGGRRPRTTARPSVFAILAFKNLDDREVAEIA
jgi:hypothetical protein